MSRCSAKLTLNTYTYVVLFDISDALETLPGMMPQAEKQTALALKTGTNDLPVNAVALPGQADVNRMARNGALLGTETRRPVAPNSVNAESGTSVSNPLSMQEICDNQGDYKNAPGGSRTCNLRFRRPTLYPIELRAHVNVLPGSIDEWVIILNMP